MVWFTVNFRNPLCIKVLKGIEVHAGLLVVKLLNATPLTEGQRIIRQLPVYTDWSFWSFLTTYPIYVLLSRRGGNEKSRLNRAETDAKCKPYTVRRYSIIFSSIQCRMRVPTRDPLFVRGVRLVGGGGVYNR